jgi:hypothetical protein
MKTQKLAAMLLTLALSLGASQVVLAGDDCSTEIDAVRTEVNWGIDPTGICYDDDNDDNDGTLVGHKNGERTCNGLNGKLNDADKKIDQGKIEDAKWKLENFQAKIDSLAMRRKPIIDGYEYNALNGPLQIAKVCVAGL